jgi:cell fate regulator YaaT (PSP1 superfamily)
MPRYVLRYGSTRAVGLFSSRGQDRFQRGMRVIARTPRGLEAAEVLAEATDEQARQLEGSPSGQIMREMTADDANELAHLQQQELVAFETCQRHVARLGLPMQLVDIERVFGGERLVVYYLAEERVDFRELVKALASEFQTRIEMRQIGVRDEAKLLADYGDCGQPVCCGTFLSEMPPVSMKMAKVQKATLDPTKISGRCGRLKCCLRYEYDIYEELQQELPPVGSDVVTTTGRARVLGQEILAQQLLVATEDNRRILIPASDVLTVLKTGSGRRPDRGARSDGERQPRSEGPARGEGPARREEQARRRGRDAGGADQPAGDLGDRGDLPQSDENGASDR